MTVRIGLCGASMALPSYAKIFNVLEVQQTFYEPPQDATMHRWRDSVPADFEFIVKAWQLITHESKSSTYRRLRTPLTAEEKAQTGRFRPTPIVQRGWAKTLECAGLLRASAVLLQCPPSFRPTEENVDNLRAFVNAAERPGGLRLLWEPRGPWPDTLVAELCAELDLIHAADPFLRPSLTTPAYYRLHGITGARHIYTDAELDQLTRIVGADDAYVMFNNIDRADDARRFATLTTGAVPDS